MIIDLIGYRKHGHNEVDEPMFTQPLMYKKIAVHPSPMNIYTSRCVSDGSFTAGEVAEVEAAVSQAYDDAWDASEHVEIPTDTWKGTQSEDSPWQTMKVPRQAVNRQEATGLDLDVLRAVGKALVTAPEGFSLHRNLKKLNKAKAAMFEEGESGASAGVDWATGEALAIGTLLLEKHNVRLTGQDVERGTFSHRHAKVVDQVK